MHNNAFPWQFVVADLKQGENASSLVIYTLFMCIFSNEFCISLYLLFFISQVFKMKFPLYIFIKVFIFCSHSLAWKHGDSLNTIIVNNSIFSKDLQKFSFSSVINDDLLKPKSCYKPSTCIPVKNHTCFGVKLAYSHTSLSLSNATSLEENLVSAKINIFK